VDDSPRALALARSLGARTVLVGAVGAMEDGMMYVDSLAELPALLQQMA